MPTFNYKAKDRSGNTVTGVVEADSESHAAGLVRDMGHLPMDIKAAGFRPPAQSAEAGSAFARHLIYPIWTGVNLRHLMFFYRQMATLLASGMSLSEALRSVRRRSAGKLGAIILEMSDIVSHGGRLSQVMARYPRIFSQLQLSLVRIGEGGGMLEEMMDRIASYIEYEMKVRRMVGKVMFYPFLILLAIIFIPKFPILVLGSGRAFLEAVWNSNKGFLYLFVTAVVVFKLLLQFEAARQVWDCVKIVPPVIGTTARKIAMSRFSRALAVLNSAGIPMTETISASADACANVYLAHRIKTSIRAVQAGEGLTQSLAATGAVSGMVLDMLATGERSGSMDGVLQKVADYMDEEADATIHKLGVGVFVLAILIAGVIVLMMLMQGYSNLAHSEGI